MTTVNRRIISKPMNAENNQSRRICFITVAILYFHASRALKVSGDIVHKWIQYCTTRVSSVSTQNGLGIHCPLMPKVGYKQT